MMKRTQQLLAAAALFLCLLLSTAATAAAAAGGNHSSNWAVIVGASRFWYNYRHVANALGVYRAVRALGVPDSHVLLMLSDDVACNARNAFPAQVFAHERHATNVYGERVEVDYRGAEVTVESFLRIIEGRHAAEVPAGKRLLSDAQSNVLVYLTGHGGEEFLKCAPSLPPFHSFFRVADLTDKRSFARFQDSEELTGADLADSVAQMHARGRYREMLVIIDTCQAASINWRLRSPGVISIGGAEVGENSYSYKNDAAVGLAVVDRFTYHMLDFVERNARNGASLLDLFRSLSFAKLNSHATWRTDLLAPGRNISDIPITDFFGANSACVPTPAASVEDWWSENQSN